MAVNNSEDNDALSSQEQQRQRDANESDLDPQAFLQSVRALSEKREREDAERYRKLEEEVAKGREERAARRAERARSLSPEKANISTPSNRSTFTLSRTTTNASLASPPPIAMTPPSSVGSRETTAHSDSLQRLTGSSQSNTDPDKQSPKVEDVPDFRGFGALKRSSTTSASSTATTPQRSSVPDASPAQSATNLARSGTLSWQQRRPTSRIGGSSSRPLSVVATHNSAAHSKTTSIDEPEPSRDQIAASLSSRDPSWFKQTAERGIGSAAYRKSKDEAGMEENASAGRRGLPGLSRERSVETDRHASPPMSESMKSDSRNSPRESVYSTGSRYSAISSSSSTKPDLKSLIAADEGQRRVSPSFASEQGSTASADSAGIARSVTMSSSQARLTNGSDRPVSPTKGIGGFVQSAMMKRSDSQNKRWSAQPSTSVSRHNSVASSRSSGLQNSHSMPRLDTTQASSDAIEERPSRPTSSSNRDTSDPAPAQDSEVFVKPALPRHSRSKSVASTYSTNDDLPQSPGSPSKRFSPSKTKSSWIESSLTKPESPKMAPSKNSAPSWMADLANRKAQRASADSTPSGANSPYAERDESKPISRPGSPLKPSPFGPSMLKRPESREFASTPGPATPTNNFKSGRLAEKESASSMPRSPSPVKHNFSTPEQRRTNNETASDDHQPTPVKAAPAAPIPATTQQPTEEKVETAPPQPSPIVERPSTPESKATRPRAKSFKSPPPPTKTQPGSEATTPKVPNDFRSQLKSRPPPEMKTEDQPEFLSKFGNLRKTQPEKFVAPDVLKDNILRGKSGLAASGGPVKTERKDELRDSLLAKKDDIKKAKDEGRDLPGQMHERKTSKVIQEPPSKPEALSKRELLGRSDSSRSVQPAEKTREATPEALARHKSLKHKSVTMPPSDSNTATEPEMDVISKQVSAPSSVSSRQSEQTSKLAARFNPGLAGLLARGPPSTTPSRTGSPATIEGSESAPNAVSEPPAANEPLQDMRKDRAKGPRRKGGAKASSSKGGAISTPVAAAQPDKTTEAQMSPTPISASKPTITATNASLTKSPPLPGSPNFSRPKPSAAVSKKPSIIMGSYEPRSSDDTPNATPQLNDSPDSPVPIAKSKPQALPGSAAAVLSASLKKTSIDQQPANAASETKKPVTPAKSPSLASKPSITFENAGADSTAVPEFKGFGSMKKQRATQPSDADKENTNESVAAAKTTASFWGRRAAPQSNGPPSPIQLPTKKDEEAAMRSAGLLSKSGLGISSDKTGDRSATPSSSAGLPPKPAKSSRIVSGQLAEASPNKGSMSSSPVEHPATEAGRLLLDAFGTVPKSRGPLTITASAIISGCEQASDTEHVKSSRKTVFTVYPDGSFQTLPPQEEYTLFDESVFVCLNIFTNSKGVKVSQVFMWIGDAAFGATADAANVHAKRLARENGTTGVITVRQGREPATFLQAFGGILITRRQSRETATKQYMLCGRKHLGHIVFDEVDFGIDSLRAGFVYLISYPVTLQETKLYLWKGSGSSVEEISAARLAAMDLSETGDIIEVDGGAEFSSFLKIFGPSTTKSDIPMPSELWRLKALAPDKFKVRLFKIQQPETKNSLLTSLWSRRPSWNRLSPARAPSVPLEDIRVEARHISPFTQSHMEAEGIYLLDAQSQLYIIIGSLFSSQSENVRNTLLAQALLFASDYATLAASMEDRLSTPKCSVLFSGVPDDVKVLFRHWDDSRGLWGTAGLMAGASVSQGRELKIMPLEDVLTEVCRD